MIIGHYEYKIWGNGGIATYIRQIGQAQKNAGQTVHYLSCQPCSSPSEDETPTLVNNEQDLFAQAEKLKLDILHLHTTVQTLPPSNADYNFAIVRTIHIHHPYCPSGSQFLARSQLPCHRSYNFTECLKGHFIDRCGSIRPQNLLANFRYTWSDQSVLPKISTITVSQFLKDQMLRSGYPESSIQVLRLCIENAINETPLLQDVVPRFVFLGRIVPQKGLRWLLFALQKVPVRVHLDIAGDGYEEAELRVLCTQLGLDEQVTFHGWVDSTKATHLIQSARAVIFPSMWHEPAGYITLEAAVNCRAVIGSRVGAIPEYADKLQNALLVEPGNVESLANAMTQLAEDWSLAKRLGEQGKRLVDDEFNCQKHLNQLNCIYEQSIQSRA